MQYETIILELMTRIKKLEDEVALLKMQMEHIRDIDKGAADSQVEEPVMAEAGQSSVPYGKTTDQMIEACYAYGKVAFGNRGTNLWELADKVAATTGMNRNSAFMYICAVKSMLEGSVYKRAVNAKAQRMYFSNIYREFGRQGLARAIQAAMAHAEYRKQCNIPADTVEAICREFQSNLR